jgi:hypothetical protein
MKRCAFCGGEYPAELAVCPLDRQPLDYDIRPPVLPVTPSWEEQPVGTAFDVSTIAPQIRRVRQDHMAALRARPHHASYRAVLVAMTRRVVTRFSFFRRESSEHKVESRDT